MRKFLLGFFIIASLVLAIFIPGSKVSSAQMNVCQLISLLVSINAIPASKAYTAYSTTGCLSPFPLSSKSTAPAVTNTNSVSTEAANTSPTVFTSTNISSGVNTASSANTTPTYPQDKYATELNTLAAKGEMVDVKAWPYSYLPAAKAWSIKNNRPFLIVSGDRRTCDYTISFLNDIMGSSAWKDYAKKKGLLVLYVDQQDAGTTFANRVLEYVFPKHSWPAIYVVKAIPTSDTSNTYVTYVPTVDEVRHGNLLFPDDKRFSGLDKDKIDLLGDFVYRDGAALWTGNQAVNGYISSNDPQNFIRFVEYFTGPLLDINS